MGNLIWSYFHCLMRDWLDGRGRIEKISVRYLQPNLRESVLTIRAKVSEVFEEAGASRVALELVAQDDADRQLVTGQAMVVLAPPGKTS
jgi:hypothetical protein